MNNNYKTQLELIWNWFDLIENLSNCQSVYPDILQKRLREIGDLVKSYKEYVKNFENL